MRILVISAAEFEAAPVLRQLAESNISSDYACCGIGSINAAKVSKYLGDLAKGRHVLFVGTCGSFFQAQLGEVVSASKVSWKPVCERFDLADSIEGIYPEVCLDPKKKLVQGLRDVQVLCCPTISRVKHFELLPELAVENLEVYSVVHELLENAKSLDILLGISNQVGPEGRREWRENFELCSKMTAQVVRNSLRIPSIYGDHA